MQARGPVLPRVEPVLAAAGPAAGLLGVVVALVAHHFALASWVTVHTCGACLPFGPWYFAGAWTGYACLCV